LDKVAGEVNFEHSKIRGEGTECVNLVHVTVVQLPEQPFVRPLPQVHHLVLHRIQILNLDFLLRHHVDDPEVVRVCTIDPGVADSMAETELQKNQ